MTPSSTPRVAVFGCGYWGRNVVRNFYGLGALGAVVDPTESGRAAAAQLAPGVPVYSDPEAAFSRSDLHAIVLATPASTHANLGLRALDAGKDLLVEKPMTLTVAEGRQLVARAAATQRMLHVGHLLEYHPSFLKLREWVSNGRLGKILRLHSHRLGFGLVRTEEDALWSLAPHDLALVLRVMGDLPEAVTCHGTHALGQPRADFAVSLLHFSGGVDAHLLSSWLHPMKEQKFVVVGDRGMAVFDDANPDYKLAYFEQHVTWKDGQPGLHKGPVSYEPLVPAEPLRLECAAFLQAVATRQPSLTDGLSGLRVVAVLDACRRSMESGGLRTRVESV
ncbi:Gfo/Idh/MocA family protein [Horticoccus sp. 23ND18S-11]|uniref:Gfo/Idh/MocA family protein n=1 Tax=Horticoccus sp. 23ND18S-11 TaxID=3391832 RepID=UPI0039C9137F